MTRAIRLSRIHALNWYGYRDTIEVDGNLLLAGVTGSGKSILMDLIQLVLVGDQRAVRFNQSATGDRSDRTLKGYVLGDTKQEEDGVTQYMRSSAIAYVALEFTWPDKRKQEPRRETWGLRVEFTSAAEAQGNVKPFLVPTRLERSDFLDEQKKPLELPAFKALVEARGGRFYADGLEPYLRDMGQPAHLNFERAVLRNLLPTAMSFTFLRSFDEFCRQFILPAERLDVSDVTESYKTFLRYEADLLELKDQLQRLQHISTVARDQAHQARDHVLGQYLEAEFRRDFSTARVVEEDLKLARLRRETAVEEARLREIDALLPEQQNQRDRLGSIINETPEGRAYAIYKSRNTELVGRIRQLSEIGTSLEQALKARVRQGQDWLKQVRALPLDLEVARVAVSDFERALGSLESGGVAQASTTLGTVGTTAAAVSQGIGRAVAATQKELGELRAKLGPLREEIAALRLGRLPFPTRLLDALNQSLLRRGEDLAARPLCHLCEVADETWRPAIEVAFTRKFAVIVAPEDYERAEAIYHQLREEAARESLIHPGKALALARPVQPGSLAEKLRTDHPVARAVVSQLFGDLQCVANLKALRALPAGQNGILADGFMARGAFVERPRHYDNLPFVGKRGLAQQLAWKEQQREELEKQEARLRPVTEAVQLVQESYRERFEVPGSLYQDLARAQELPRLRAELDKNIQELNAIDRTEFDRVAQQQREIEERIKVLAVERDGLLKSPMRADCMRVENTLRDLRGVAQRCLDAFEQFCQAHDISPWLTRLGELREQLAAFPALDVAAERAGRIAIEADKQAGILREQLLAARRELVQAHPKYDELPIEAPTNTAYELPLQRLVASDIPEYSQKAEQERKSWEHLFRNQVLTKLKAAVDETLNELTLLNIQLKQKPIGANIYQVSYQSNPDFKDYRELLEANAGSRPDELFFASAEPRFQDALKRFMTLLLEQPDSQEAIRLLDYRHYHNYDMVVTDVNDPARRSSVDKHSGKFSGGENQSPYFIAILASYLRAYKRHSRRPEPSLALVPIDEAFSKLSGERIKDCLTALKSLDLQGVFSMSTGNIPYAFEHCDSLVVVDKTERREGKRLIIRNTPVLVAKNSERAMEMLTHL